MDTYGFGAFDAGTLAVLAIIGVAVLAIAVVEVAAKWMTLQKMARHDFAALVPGFDCWELARGAGASVGYSVAFVIMYALASLSGSYAGNAVSEVAASALRAQYGALPSGPDALGALPGIYQEAFGQVCRRLLAGDFMLIAALVLSLVYLIMTLRVYYGVSRSFGHGVAFSIGMILVPVVFFAILGFSKKQTYQGPLLDADYLLNPRNDWSEVVKARIETFGSNAPLALAVIGMMLGGLLLTLPGIVLCIISLVRNAGEKRKSLAKGKSKAALIAAVAGIIISVAAIVVTALVLFSLAHIVPVSR